MPKQSLRPWLMFVDDPSNEGGGSGNDTGEQQQDDGGKPERTFTQDDLDKAVRDRLNREKAKFADYGDLKAKADQLDQLTAAQKTAEQRAADDLAKAQKAAADALADAVRYKAAGKAGIDPESDDFALIGSGDEETVMTRAARLGALLASERELAQLKEQQGSKHVPDSGRPRPVLRPGATPVDATGRPGSIDAAREAALRRGRISDEQTSQ
jgi:hypothetical protein